MMPKQALAVLLLAFVLLAGISVDTASAQLRGPTFYRPPAGPTLSPYLLYSRRPTGIYDNYHTFVQPRIELRATQRIQNQELGRLNRELRNVQGDVRTLSEIRDAGVNPTGIGSAYMNYSHYYPGRTGR